MGANITNVNGNYLPLLTIPNFWGWTSYTPVIPKLYWDVYSQEERIKRLCMEYDKLTHYASMLADEINKTNDNVDGKLNEIKEYVDNEVETITTYVTEALEKQSEYVDGELEKLRQYIDNKLEKYAEGTVTYDPTTGTYRPSIETNRRMMQALSYPNKGEQQLVSYVETNMDVGQLADRTCYNVAMGNQATITIDDQK